ncbi:MAG TPA: hypothetical protein VFX70_04160 [Mycobacteriales bacterium]|nr:hypothetical protein [Mycobacteriales bacterium]
MPLTPDQMNAFARKVILGAVEDILFDSIGEVLQDELDGLSDDAYDEACQQVDTAIRSATVTVSWKPDAGTDN